jgi:Transcriptional regulators
LDWRHAHLNRIIARTVKLHHSLVQQMLSEFDLHPGQPPLLLALGRQDGRSQNELAQELRITPATLTMMVKRMEKNGLLVRRTDPQDLRVSRVSLTDKGRQALSAAREALEKLEEAAFVGFAPEEKELLRSLMLRVYENLAACEQAMQPSPPS